MSIKRVIKNGIKQMLMIGRPIHKVTANIAVLAPNQLLQGRNALITGGTSGIGLSIAKAFLQSGANVIITGRSAERLEKAQQELNALGTNCQIITIVMDNSNIASMEHIFCSMLTQIKGGRIDILVNNAGVLGTASNTTEEECFDMVLDVNLKGSYFLSKLVADQMVKNGIRGNILNICSSSSCRPATSPYALSKWSLRGLTIGMAKALIKEGIVVNGLAPGPTATPMLINDGYDGIELNNAPIGRYATVEEMGNLATILVSDMGRVIVGDILYATGGAGIITYDDIDYKFIS